MLSLAAVAVLSIVSCSDEGSSEGSNPTNCVPGQQVSCPCTGGPTVLLGTQVCKDDGSRYGPCSCGEGGSSGWPGSGGAPQSGGAAGVGGEPVGGAGGVAGGAGGEPVGGAGGSAPTFTWAWVTYPGPAFASPPCSAAAGVADGMLVDPQAFFSSLVSGKDPNDWQQVLSDIEPELWACGVGQQRDSGGTVRGRLFLPNAGCPSAAPPDDDARAKFLGVRQDEPCWDLKVDVVGENP
jgi:hypothetical protein